MLLAAALLFPVKCAAEEAVTQLPRQAQALLEESGVEQTAPQDWSLDAMLDYAAGLIVESAEKPLQFCIKTLMYLLAACSVGLLAANSGWKSILDTVAVLGFGTLCLSALMELTAQLCDTALQCQTYLAAFVPVYAGVAALGGQTAGAAAYSGVFLAVSGFLSEAIRQLVIPVMKIYFCFVVSAAIWKNQGLSQAAALFGRCLGWGLKCCGAALSFVLGLQTVFAGSADSAALRLGRSVLSGAIPVVGDAAASALSGAAAALQLLKGSLAAAAVVVLGGAFAPLLLRCAVYTGCFYAAGVVAAATGQRQCGQICDSFAQGTMLCASVLVLYFFLVFLSTLLLLVTGGMGV